MKPTRGFYTNYRTHREIRKSLRLKYTLLDKCIAIGSHVCEWIRNDLDYPCNIACESLYNQLLEQIDATSILFRKGSCEPCKSLARTASESAILIHYLLKENTQDRSYAYIMSFAINSLIWSEKLDPSTDRGRSLRDYLSSEPAEFVKHIQSINGETTRDELDRIFFNPPYRPIWDKWKQKLNASWYWLDTDIDTLAVLSYKIEQASLYEFIFRAFSEYSHGGTRASFHPNGTLLTMRSPHGSYEITCSLHATFESATSAIALQFTKEKQTRILDWLVNEINPARQRVDHCRIPNVYEVDNA